ncbi:uncharacterized protein LOC127725229 [Mytilus californianus]|uniref:uncharacterized protein LOC127725229 n=1 Tax=Mytilus californianus TaxID=6549 RepID=UPI00224786F3|nr:uncharacterized protein LOC127725229 [Mytilus californianus]
METPCSEMIGASIQQTDSYKKSVSLYQASWDDLRQCIAKNHVDLTHLSAVLVKLENKTHFDKKRQNEVEDIETSVTEIVQTILDKMGVYDNTCRDLRLIKAGGYFDGTKIRIPDEFDFVVDISSLSSYFSTKTKEEVQIDCWKEDSSRVNVRVVGTPDPTVAIFCPDVCMNASNRQESASKCGPTGVIMNKKFSKLFTSLFKKVVISFIEDGMIVTRSTGTMKIMPDLVNILANTLDDSFLPFYTLWIPKRDTEAVGISIDITPSFRLDSDYLNFNRTFVNVDALKKISGIIGKDNCFMRLVLRDDDHWRLSLSHVETEVIREADDIHKMCSRILKMLKEGKPLDADQDHIPNASYMESSARSFKFTEMCTSYTIKTAILRHIISCNRSTCGLGNCFISILLEVEEMVKSGEFTGLFIGINKKESTCTGNWELDTLSYLSRLNTIFIDLIEGREQDETSAAEQVCQERKKYIHDICTSDDFKDIQDWYIGAI